MESCEVLVVGAGAAGLMAARELGLAGKSVVILEARDRIGGRIYPLDEKEFGYPAQGGAEFVQGAAPISRKLLEEAGVTLTNPGEWWNVFDGAPVVSEWISPHDDLLESALNDLKEDMTIEAFLQKYFTGEEYAALRNFIIRRCEGYDAADYRRASAFGLRDEMLDTSGFHQMNIREGYGKLLEYLARECASSDVKIVLDAQVKEIDTSAERIIVRSADDRTYEVLTVVVTVPLPVLQDIRFIPAIPEKLEAAAKIGFGPVIKILLRFKSKWWTGERERNFERMFFMFSHEAIPTWWTQYPEPHTTLTGWVAGPSAAKLSHQSDAELLEMALASLSNIFKISEEELQSELVVSKVVNWEADPYARGAYSYVTPESKAAIEELLKPVDGRLYFSGEGVYQGDISGTVEAALASGLETAKKILK